MKQETDALGDLQLLTEKGRQDPNLMLYALTQGFGGNC
jgi:hypothetical protein